MICSCRFTNTL
uniref:Uncharacterized protein n=1 Tax=Rhizophora mucronata TaxID=61149 RepID=A0A2P2QCT1_RHIMU